MEGPNTPPEPPEASVNEVARIFRGTSSSNASGSSRPQVAASIVSVPVPKISGANRPMSPTIRPPMAGLRKAGNRQPPNRSSMR
jgi:hypothetical protein